ncbi:hypothetical protein [Allosphingosinicella flava]|nr:hypothetical protein [Sphingosinicella flava]
MGAASLFPQPSLAQAPTVQQIEQTSVIDVPLLLTGVDANGAAQTLWAKGKKPDNPLLARLSLKPVQAATLAMTDAPSPDDLLWRAFPNEEHRGAGSSGLKDSQGPRYFCGANAAKRQFFCMIDKDADGRFDHIADALPERGMKPYHLTLMKAVKPLDAPQPYRILADEARPEIPVELRNCAKDYDRPRYAASSTVDRDMPVSPAAFGWHDKDSSFASCRRGTRLSSWAGGAASVSSGGYIAGIGPLAFTVGPKNNPQLGLLGAVQPDGLFRLEGATLVNLGVGYTPNQAQLMAIKKFPYPMLMTDEGAVIHEGMLSPGKALATVPFHHAYRGVLKQDVSVSTLISKRSLAAGTVVYGFPARSRMEVTRGGMPDFQPVGDEEYRQIDLDLTWCAPIHDDEPQKEKAQTIGKGGWSAACVPYSNLGNHTVLTGRQPAFAVTGLSYDATTSSNDGPPPIERNDAAAFERPLRVDYVYEKQDGEFILISERIYYGDALTSSTPRRIYAPSGMSIVKIAGAQVELKPGPEGITVTKSGPPLTGADPLLSWDERALLLQQLKKMGLKVAEPEGQDSGAE